MSRVFISYAHESDAHAEAVRDLWIFLRVNGVDAQIDRVAAQRRAEADADLDEGRGVQYEARLIRNRFFANQSDLNQVLPVVLPGGSTADLPAFLTPATSTVYPVSAFTVAGAGSLLRLLHGRSEETQPGLGPVPDVPDDRTVSARPGTAASSAAARSPCLPPGPA